MELCRNLEVKAIGGEATFRSAGENQKTHKSFGMSVEGSGDHVTTDSSLSRVLGRWSACGWSVVQLDHHEEMAPMHGMHETLDAVLEVQRTIKRAALTAFLLTTKESLMVCGEEK